MVTIWSNIAIEWWWTIAKKASHILTLLFFISLLRILWTHLTDFVVRREEWCEWS
jgi:hypothetical protein